MMRDLKTTTQFPDPVARSISRLAREGIETLGSCVHCSRSDVRHENIRYIRSFG